MAGNCYLSVMDASEFHAFEALCEEQYVAFASENGNSHLNGEITSFVGIKKNMNVSALVLHSIKMYDIPKSIKNTFAQLTCLCIWKCGLKEISRKSLIGLESLKTLFIQDNQITSLPKDLLVNMPRLQRISFRTNLLEFIDSQMLSIMKNKLRHVDFRSNPTIDEYYSIDDTEGSVSLHQLICLIDAKCQKPQIQLNVSADFFVERHKKLWETGEFSDFIVETSLVEFKVHKAILGASCPVFAAMFATIMKEQQDSRMVIKDFSSEVVKEFLRFFYVGSVTRSINAVDMFKLAEKYNVEDLKYFCVNILLDTIQENNVVEILELGTLYNIDYLKTEAFRVIQTALQGRYVPSHWIDEPNRLKEIMEAKLHFDSLFTESNSGHD